MRFLLLMGLGFLALLFMAPVWWGVAHIVGGVMPWLLIGLLFWGVKSLFGGPRHYRHGWARRYDQPYRRAAAAPAYAPPLAKPQAANRLPLDVEMKAAQIRRK